MMNGSLWRVLRKCNSLEEGMANHLSQENTRHSMKSQKDMTPEDEAPRLEGIQYTTREEWGAITNSSRKNEAAAPKQK